MASMASMVAEGGGGEQVTPDQAMQMQNAALQPGGAHVRTNEIYMFTGNAAKLRGVPCIYTEKVSVNIE